MSSLSQYDSENRFMRCAMEHKMEKLGLDSTNRFDQFVTQTRLDYPRKRAYDERDRDSIPIREKRNDSLASTNNINKYPNSKLRSKQDIRTEESKVIHLDSFEDNFPTLNSSPGKPKTPIMLPIHSPKSEKSPIRIIDSITSLSLQGGKLVKKEIVTIVEEPPPLVITPSKWSDLLRTSAN